MTEPIVPTDAPDWDAIAARLGLPADWREQGFDSPEYIASEDSIYRDETGGAKCPWPECQWTRKKFDTEAAFRHAHGHYKAWKKVHGDA